MPDLEPLEGIVEDAVGDLDLISNSSRATMDDITSSNAVNMDITNMMEDLVEGLDNLTFTELQSELSTQADNMDAAGLTTIANSYRTLLADINHIDGVTKPRLADALDYLTGNLTDLKTSITNLVNSVSSIVISLDDLEETIKGDGVDMVLEDMQDFIDSIFNIADQILDYVSSLLNNDIGRCRVVYDVYMGILNTVCVFFLDAFNGLWMAMCIIGFFSAVNFVVALVYSKYIRLPSGVGDASSIQTAHELDHPSQTILEMKELMEILGEDLTPSRGKKITRSKKKQTRPQYASTSGPY